MASSSSSFGIGCLRACGPSAHRFRPRRAMVSIVLSVSLGECVAEDGREAVAAEGIAGSCTNGAPPQGILSGSGMAVSSRRPRHRRSRAAEGRAWADPMGDVGPRAYTPSVIRSATSSGSANGCPYEKDGGNSHDSGREPTERLAQPAAGMLAHHRTVGPE